MGSVVSLLFFKVLGGLLSFFAGGIIFDATCRVAMVVTTPLSLLPFDISIYTARGSTGIFFLHDEDTSP